MFALKHLFLYLFFMGPVFSGPCASPDTIFNGQSLSTIFDQALDTIHYQSSFFDFISDPSTYSLKSYLMSNAKAFIPLWCLGGLTLILFVACLIQMCCFNLCKQQSCGTKINKKAYRPDCVKCLVYFFIFLSFTVVGLGITSFILSSDLLKESDYAICSYNNTFNQLFDGLPAGSSPAWSGVDNFDTYATKIATNFPNVVSTLADIFQSPEYQAIASDSPNSLYSNAVASYDCPASLASSTVSCPFSNLSSCFAGSNTQLPVFSASFCLTNVNNSAASLVLYEQEHNSTLWKQSLVNLSSNILSYNTSLPNFDQLQADAASLQSSITNYKPSLANGIQTAQDNFYSVEIGLYTIFSFIIFIGVSAFIGIYCAYCSKVYGCRYILYFLWIFFMLLGVIFFAASGVLVIGTFAAFDSCNAYAELSGNSTALPSLSYYGDTTVTELLFTCFFPSEGSIDSVFNSLSQQTSFEQLSQLQSQYYSSLPSSTFQSVVTGIRNQLNYYASNPNSVALVNASNTQSPQAALNAANAYASNGGRPSCQAVNDTFAYNPLDCYPLPLNQPAGDPSCILINNGSVSIVTNRQSSFLANNCGGLFATYQSNFNSLNNYGNDVAQLVSQYQNDSGLETYYTSYFNYYSAVHNFMNNYTQQLFLSFISPFQSLVAGSSCSFLTQSLNSLAFQTCNKAFPFAYVLTIFVIVLGCLFFLLMILSYYLTVRLQFYEYLQGDLTKYDPNATSNEHIEIEMTSITNRQQLIDKSPAAAKEVPATPEVKPQEKNERGESNRNNRYQRYARYNGEYQDRYARTDPRYNYSRYETVDQPRQPSPPRYTSPYRR